VDIPRQCVFVATTNEATYLRDPTGNRRFWPVKCGRIRLDALHRDRDQLWAEAVHRFDSGEPWHPTGPEIELTAHEQAQRVLVTELEQRIAEYLDAQLNAGITETTTGDVFRFALDIDPAHDVERAGRLGRQLADALQNAGWQRVKAMGRGRSRRVVYRKTTP
jgi:predicted P-loop ATPase